MSEEKHAIGARIIFKEDLTDPASGDHPSILYARKGGLGTVVSHDSPEGYMVVWDEWPNAFGAYQHEFEVIEC